MKDLLEHFKRQNELLTPMINPEDIGQDFIGGDPIPEDSQAKDSIQQAPGRTDQQMQDQQDYMNDQNYNRLKDNNDLPGQNAQGRDPANWKDTLLNTLNPFTPTQASIVGGKLGGHPIDEKTGREISQTPSVEAGADSSTVTNTGPNVTTGAKDPRSSVEHISSGKEQQLPMVQTPESVNAAAKIIAQEKQIPFEDALKIAQNDASQNLATATSAKDQYENALSTLPAMQARQKEIYTKIDNQVNEINNISKIDPNRIWNQGSTGNKLAFLVSAAFGGLQADGPLRAVINSDIQAQIQDANNESENKRGVLSVFLKQGDSMREAIQNTMGFYKGYVDSLKAMGQAKMALNPENVNAAAIDLFNKNSKMIGDQHLALAGKEMEVKKTNIDIAKTNTNLREKQMGRQIEAEKYAKDQNKFTTQAGEAAEQTIKGKGAAKRLVELESKGIQGVTVDNILDKNQLRALSNEDYNSGTFKNLINEMIVRGSPQLRDNAQKSDLSEYYTTSIRLAAELAKNEGARLTEDNIANYLKRVIPGPNLTPQARARVQLERTRDAGRMAIKGGPAAEKIINLNK